MMFSLLVPLIAAAPLLAQSRSNTDPLTNCLTFAIALTLYVAILVRFGHPKNKGLVGALSHQPTPEPPAPEPEPETLHEPEIEALPEPEPELPMKHIGLIAYWGEQSAYVYHSQPVPDTAQAIQPYVQLQIKEATTYHIRFEVLNAEQQVVFSHLVEPLLVQATNFIVPPARLPLDTLKPQGQWTLRIYVNDNPLATHEFAWRHDDVERVDGHIQADGEINDDLLPLLADNYAHPLSLNDLLAGDGGVKRA